MVQTITTTGKPSCGCNNPYTNTTKTWENVCYSTTCKGKEGTLQFNPKGVAEGEITCSVCSADYCCVCGRSKDNAHKDGQLKLADGTGSSDTANAETTTETVTETFGYDLDKPFKCYIRIVYSVNDPKGEAKTILFDFTDDAPDSDWNSFTNVEPSFFNEQARTNRIEVLEKIKVREGDPEGKNEYYLRRVHLTSNVPINDEGKLYDQNTDHSSYKLQLMSIGFFTGAVNNPSTLNASGKTLLSNIKTFTEESKYQSRLVYGKYRYTDSLNFYLDQNKSDPVATFSQGINGNIIGVSNITYAPINTLINNSVKIFKSKDDPNSNDSTIKYSYAQSRNPENILRYGEITDLEVLSDNCSAWEAYNKAYTNEKFVDNMDITYSILVEGYPNVKIGDYVKTIMNDPLLSDIKKVMSIQVDCDINNRSMIRTNLGLNAVDRKMRINREMMEARRKAKEESTTVSGPIVYEDKNDHLWEDN